MKHSTHVKPFIKKTALIAPVVCSLLHLSPAAAQSPEFDDTRENGSFDQRYFARIKGTPPTPTPEPQTPPVKPAVDLLTDANGVTNELIVLLQYDMAANLRGLLGAAGKGADTATAPGLERAVLTALQNQDSKELNTLFRSPVYAQFLLSVERMTDDDRERHAKVRSPRERLERFMVLRYSSVAAARSAANAMAKEPTIASAMSTATVVLSFTPNDPYFSPVGSVSTYPKAYFQWGLHAMNFPAAWDKVQGQAQVGILDAGFFGFLNPPTLAGQIWKYTYNPHPDLAFNSRPHFTPGYIRSDNGLLSGHTTHVAGIVAAQSNNAGNPSTLPNGIIFNGGVSGGCITCSISAYSFIGSSYLPPAQSGAEANTAAITVALTTAVDSGMQIINWSGQLNASSITGNNCPNYNDAFCTALDYATQREVLIPVSVGNFNQNSNDLSPPLKYSPNYSVLPVGGTEVFSPQIGVPGSRWYYGWADGRYNGSAEASLDGVLAPAKSIPSTMLAGRIHASQPYAMCGDAIYDPTGLSIDESSGRFTNGLGDGIGSCTGTSMSAPHISALAGLIRSVNPRLTALETRSIIQNNGNLALSRTAALGYGMPNALTAVNAAINTNPGKLTPLFSFYSADRTDSFYTTVPQMGIAALMGKLMPRKNMANDAYVGADGVYYSAYGNNINIYSYFPTLDFVIGGGDFSPRAQVWLFTTHKNPKNETTSLMPIYRMSWKCTDPTPYYPTDSCNNTSNMHIDTVLVMESEVNYFKSLGYKVDGLEGYSYPKSLPQPAGTVRLIRKYHPGRDDHAIFPETAWSTMQAQGYTANTNNTDWLGYVYPNTNGSMPAIQ